MVSYNPLLLSVAYIATIASAAVAVQNVCPLNAVTAPDGRQLRFTGGGGSARRGTEQDISLDIPANIGAATELANIYLRDENMKAYQVVGKEIHDAHFKKGADSTAWERFVVPMDVPAGVYTVWANLRLENGGTCTFGDAHQHLTVLA